MKSFLEYFFFIYFFCISSLYHFLLRSYGLFTGGAGRLGTWNKIEWRLGVGVWGFSWNIFLGGKHGGGELQNKFPWQRDKYICVLEELEPEHWITKSGEIELFQKLKLSWEFSLATQNQKASQGMKAQTMGCQLVDRLQPIGSSASDSVLVNITK